MARIQDRKSTSTYSQVRQRISNVSSGNDSDSSSIEEVVREPTLYEHIEAHHAPRIGQSINYQRVKIPLAQKLGTDELIQDFSVEEHSITDTLQHSNDEDAEGDEGGPIIGDIGQAFFFTGPLCFLLLGLDILVWKQYREEMIYGEIIGRALKSFLRM